MKGKRIDPMVTRVGLENYQIFATHGAYDFEKNSPQPFVISIWATLVNDVCNDELDETLNYADLQNVVNTEVVNSKPVNLMETLCKKIVESLSENELVSKIHVRIEKPEAPLPNEGGLAVVEHEWTRN